MMLFKGKQIRELILKNSQSDGGHIIEATGAFGCIEDSLWQIREVHRGCGGSSLLDKVRIKSGPGSVAHEQDDIPMPEIHPELCRSCLAAPEPRRASFACEDRACSIIDEICPGISSACSHDLIADDGYRKECVLRSSEEHGIEELDPFAPGRINEDLGKARLFEEFLELGEYPFGDLLGISGAIAEGSGRLISVRFPAWLSGYGTRQHRLSPR